MPVGILDLEVRRTPGMCSTSPAALCRQTERLHRTPGPSTSATSRLSDPSVPWSDSLADNNR
ncbi:hypothetical protein [Nonomuraea sp. WAC 01424]|uniref:hypothetical protein n=1 Tax=Nonomuraea sp. WAC 01424 TaxID=2203200 RepID=UPI000F79DDD2|nr:hypothetical protein [Nonomuraea sp. WAC 01424]